MSFSTEMKTQATEYAVVTRLANHYAPTHVKEKKAKFISDHLETDIKVAQATAKLFAESNEIFYNDTLREPSQPIITVLKHQERWFPAELHADKVCLLTKFGSLDLGSSQQEAIHMADLIALSRRGDMIPSIGIFLAE